MDLSSSWPDSMACAAAAHQSLCLRRTLVTTHNRLKGENRRVNSLFADLEALNGHSAT
jgi:hypothetical protein